MKKDIKEKFGDQVRKIRILSHLSIEDLALNAGINKNYLSDVERGKRNISLVNIEKIANALKVTIDVFFID